MYFLELFIFLFFIILLPCWKMNLYLVHCYNHVLIVFCGSSGIAFVLFESGYKWKLNSLTCVFSVSGPSVVVETPSVDFGLVQLGEDYCKEFSIFNDSFIPVSVSCSLEDGLDALSGSMAENHFRYCSTLQSSFSPHIALIESGNACSFRVGGEKIRL